MKKETIIKIISGLIIFVFIVSFFQPIKPLEAASDVTLVEYFNNPNQNNTKNPYKFGAAQVLKSGVIQNVIGCTGVVNKVSKWMTKIVQGPKKVKQMADQLKQKKVAALKAACSLGKKGFETVAGLIPMINDGATPVDTSFENFCATKVDAKSDAEIGILLDSQEQDAERNIREQCFDGIAVTLAKNQLTSMTHSAVNWINSGYGGNPFFVQSMTNFTNNIERNVLDTGIDILISPGYTSPYARDFARSTINSYNAGRGLGQSSAKFLGGLQSDLGYFLTDPKSFYTNEELNQANDTQSALQRSEEARDRFANDFSVGGWDGWIALTQREQNNPLGFSMLANQYLADTQTRTITEKKDELTQNSGFLSQKSCILYQLYDKNGVALTDETPYSELAAGTPDRMGIIPMVRETYSEPIIENGVEMPAGEKTTVLLRNVYSKTKPSTCYKAGGDCCVDWKTVTPGSIIKDKTTNYLNSPERQLELTKTINDGINALFSVLVSKLEGQGLSGLSDSPVVTDWTDKVNLLAESDNQNTDGETSTYSNNGAYDNFNLTRDLGNTYMHNVDYYSAGTWDAKNNLTTERDPNFHKVLYPDLVPEVYNEKKEQITSNLYYTVTSIGLGKIKLILEGSNVWEKGDRAFWDGTKWQNWKKDQLSPIAKKGVIQIQKDYIVAATEINDLLPKIMPKLGELDYCIPGPNPSYKSNSSDAQTAFLDWTSSMYVGPTDITGERFGVKIDDGGKLGKRTYDNLKANYDGTGIFDFLKKENTPKLLDFATDGHNFNMASLIYEFSNICNSNGEKWWKTKDGSERACTGNYFYVKNGELEKADGDHLAEKSSIMDKVIDFTNNRLFQSFYSAFDAQMNTNYFKNITKKYNEDELTSNKSPNTDYIPMAESGYELTKNMQYYSEETDLSIKEFEDAIAQAKANINKLDPIKLEVSGIIKAAQDRRDKNLLEILKKETEKQCKSESEDCLRGIGLPPELNNADLGEYCLSKNATCLKNIMTEAQYKKKYAGCLLEENIKFYDEEGTLPMVSEEERCFDKIDNDGNGLIDEKDPACDNVRNIGKTFSCLPSRTQTVNTPYNGEFDGGNGEITTIPLSGTEVPCEERKTKETCPSPDYFPGQYSMTTCEWTASVIN